MPVSLRMRVVQGQKIAGIHANLPLLPGTTFQVETKFPSPHVQKPHHAIVCRA